jgi:hypothetical protein
MTDLTSDIANDESPLLFGGRSVLSSDLAVAVEVERAGRRRAGV